MSHNPIDADPAGPSAEVYLLGTISFAQLLFLQEAVVEHVHGRPDGRVGLLLCEHPPLITVGRAGSAADVRTHAGLIRHGQIEVRWVKRGGGTIVHAPGQLAVYPIVPLRWHGFSVGEFVDLLETALVRTLQALGFQVERRASQPGVFGRSGLLAPVGLAVRHWVTCHGAFINIAPPMGLFHLLSYQNDPARRMGSLAAEQRKPVPPTTVRAELIAQLTETLGLGRYHLHTGHPLLRHPPARR